MALFNEVLEGRYNLLLTKLLSMKGGAPAPQLNGDLSAGFTLESESPEWYAMMGSRLCIGYQGVAAGGAGNRTQIGVNNLAGSGLLIRILDLFIVCTGAINAGFVLRRGATLASVSTQVGVLDQRISQTPAGLLQYKNGTAASGSIIGFIPPDMALGTQCAKHWVNPRIVLGPGSVFSLEPGVDNMDLSVCAIWLERAANPAELSLGA